MTFDDLKFDKHPNGIEGCVAARLDLYNGITISVVGGPCLYGNGVNSFEVAAWRSDNTEWLQLSEYDDVLGWRSKEEINELIQKLLTEHKASNLSI